MKTFSRGALFAAVLLTALGAAAQDQVKIEVHKVRGDIYMLTGQGMTAADAAGKKPPRAWRSNWGAVS